MLFSIGLTELGLKVGGDFYKATLEVDSFDLVDKWTKSKTFSSLIMSYHKAKLGEMQGQGKILHINAHMDETN